MAKNSTPRNSQSGKESSQSDKGEKRQSSTGKAYADLVESLFTDSREDTSNDEDTE